jgi:glycerol kinase
LAFLLTADKQTSFTTADGHDLDTSSNQSIYSPFSVKDSLSSQNIGTCQWDPALCKAFGIPMSMLPEIRSSSEVRHYILIREN